VNGIAGVDAHDESQIADAADGHLPNGRKTRWNVILAVSVRTPYNDLTVREHGRRCPASS
jgi:hypothetical protein